MRSRHRWSAKLGWLSADLPCSVQAAITLALSLDTGFQGIDSRQPRVAQQGMIILANHDDDFHSVGDKPTLRVIGISNLQDSSHFRL